METKPKNKKGVKMSPIYKSQKKDLKYWEKTRIALNPVKKSFKNYPMLKWILLSTIISNTGIFVLLLISTLPSK